MLTPEIAGFLKRVRLCFVATVSPDAMPNVSPKGTLVALGPKRLAFADIRSPDTVANIAGNPHVEICAVDPFSRRGYAFGGTATTVTAGTEFDAASKIYEEMGVKSPIRAVVVIDVESVSEVRSPLYDLGATESEIRRSWIRRYTEG